MIRFACPSCRAGLQVTDKGAGQKIACPNCGQRLQIPAPPPRFDKAVLGEPIPLPPADATHPVHCPGCGRTNNVPTALLGKIVTCPHCSKRFVPTRSPATVSPPRAELPENPPDAVGDDNPEIRSAAPDPVAFVCPKCGLTILLQQHQLGMKVRCARCKAHFVPNSPPVRSTPTVPATHPEPQPVEIPEALPADGSRSGGSRGDSRQRRDQPNRRVVPHEDESDDDDRRRERDRRRRHDHRTIKVPAQSRYSWLVILVLVLGVGLPVLTCFGVYFVRVSTPPRNNARCPVCGKEFRIPEEHRGNNSQWIREYRCPRCGESAPAGILYK